MVWVFSFKFWNSLIKGITVLCTTSRSGTPRLPNHRLPIVNVLQAQYILVRSELVYDNYGH